MEDKKLDLLHEKPKNPTLFWAWVLGGVLVTLAVLFVLDKFRTNKELKFLDEDRKKIAAEYTMYQAEHENIKSSYSELEKSYSQLSEKYAQIRDSALLKTGMLNDKQLELINLQKIITKQDSIVKSINKVVKDAMLGFKSDELKVENRNGKVYVTMQDKLLFKSGSAEVEAKGNQALQKLAKVLLNNPGIEVLVEGHTDNVPISTRQYSDNWDLSTARATTITRILTNKYNLPSKRVTAAGRSEYYPVATNATDQGKAKNRRTEIILTPNLDELYEILNVAKVTR